MWWDLCHIFSTEYAGENFKKSVNIYQRYERKFDAMSFLTHGVYRLYHSIKQNIKHLKSKVLPQSHKAHRMALISDFVALSQTPVYTVRTRILG